MKEKAVTQLDGNGWLEETLPKHERLTPLVVSLIKNSMRTRAIDYLDVVGRTKSHEGAREKIERKAYKRPQDELTDLSGIRVITYFDSQIQQISRLIRELFVVDETNSSDRKINLGRDRVGYRSVHFVCTLGVARSGLLEYAEISSLVFEIQLRTVLQHAWAELTHDRSYKFAQALPEHIERKLNLYAGLLEIADGAFDEISKEVDDYAEKLKKAQPVDVLPEPINSLSVLQFLRNLNSALHIPGRVTSLRDEKPIASIIHELSDFGLESIADLHSLINNEFVDAYKKSGLLEGASGFLRSAMLFADPEHYLKNVDRDWNVIGTADVRFLGSKHDASYIVRLLQRHGVHVDHNEEIDEEDDRD